MIIYETLHTKYYTVAGKVTWLGKRIIVQLFRQHLGFHGKIGWRVFRETKKVKKTKEVKNAFPYFSFNI